MKNRHFELLRTQMRDFHRHHPWRLHDGLFIPHTYTEPCSLSWWDDVGFILNGRRVMVWWQHPRSKFSDEIAKRAQQEAGVMPDEPLFRDEARLSKRVGRSRKRVVVHRTQCCSEALRAYFDRANAIEQRLLLEGIDYSVGVSMTMRRYRWGVGMELCAPLEVCGVDGVRRLASLARRLAKREVTVEEAFPGYRYDRDMWLNEARERGGRHESADQMTAIQRLST